MFPDSDEVKCGVQPSDILQIMGYLHSLEPSALAYYLQVAILLVFGIKWREQIRDLKRQARTVYFLEETGRQGCSG